MCEINARLTYYSECIDDVALEISQDSYWRKYIFANDFDSKIPIKSDSDKLPSYIKERIIANELSFFVSKVRACPENFDEGLVIFKFESVEFPNIIRFTGN